MPFSMQIELAQPGELAEIAALINSGYRGDSARAGWTSEADLFEGARTDPASLAKELHAKGRIMLVLRNDGGISGCVSLQPNYGADKRGCYLGMLTVSPLVQAKGLGRRLMEAAEAKARELGNSYMVLWVLNPRAELMAWYERHGYKRTGETTPFPYAQAVDEKPTRPDLHFILFSKDL